jgi:3-mercaptopyruvate sulfurtransferase SseA
MKILNCEEETIKTFIDNRGGFIYLNDDVYKYFEKHIINSTHLPPSVFMSTTGSLPVQFHPPTIINDIVCRAGLKQYQNICVYSEPSQVLSSSLVIYLLERLNFKNVYLLNGNYNNLPISLLTKRYCNLTSIVNDNFDWWPNESISFVEFTTLLATKTERELQVIDVRGASMYNVKETPWLVNGNILGSINVPWKNFVEPDNEHKLKPFEEIKKILSYMDVSLSKPTIVYSGTGRDVSLAFIIMKELGMNVRIYEGSWSEYHWKHLEGELTFINTDGGYKSRFL